MTPSEARADSADCPETTARAEVLHPPRAPAPQRWRHRFRTSFAHHPKGLAYLAFAEAWERFSFYGMQALLVLYMVDHLFRGDRLAHVIGFDGFRRGLEWIVGPLSGPALASQIFGLYAGFVYFTPLFGGIIGDRLLGQRRTVMLGAVLMAAGHALMAIESAFLLALLLLIVGCGCLKGNISAQVGNLYASDDVRRESAFSIFNVGINLGAFAAPLVCGTLGELYGWAWGFGAAAIGMLIGLAIYVSGYKHLPPDTLRKRCKEETRRLSRRDLRIVLGLCSVIVLSGFFSIAHDQCANLFSLWAREKVDRHLLGWEVPVTWFQSLDAGLTVAFTPIAIRIWQCQAARGKERSEVHKLRTASLFGLAANALLALAAWAAGPDALVPLLWAVLYVAILSFGFLYQWPPTLALISRAAPPAVNSTLMGCAFMSLFFTNAIVGWLGRFYSILPAWLFWLIHGLIGLAGALVLLVAGPPLERLFREKGSVCD